MFNLSFYPTVSETLLNSAGCIVKKYEFSYLIEDNYLALRPRGKNVIKLEDSLDSWKIEADGLRVCRQIIFESPSVLFGEKGVLCQDAKFGVCIIWNNRTLTQMGYIMPEPVIASGEKLIYNFKYDFLPGEIKGDLLLDLVIYLKEPAVLIREGEEHLINEAGVIIGTIDSVSLDFNNLQMDFPIKEIKDPTLPLWWLELNQWTDPTLDPFDEDHVCLYLNSYYKQCPKVGSTIKNVDILVEIFSTVYLIMIKEIERLGYLRQTIQDVDLECGSISKIIFYFYDNCNNEVPLILESITDLQKTIRINIEKMLKGE